MIKRNLVLIGAAIAVLVSTGCAVAQSYSEDEIGLRKPSLYEEEKTVADLGKFVAPADGESTPIARSFENAPPMISHDVEGMLPITRDYNACLDCHMPGLAEALNTLPVPESHFATFRPKVGSSDSNIIYDGKAVDNTADVITVVHKMDELSGERYVCSSCHAPQSSNAQLVENVFSPEFRDKDGIAKSNFLDVLNDGI